MAEFIEEVARRLAIAGVPNSQVALRWSRVSQSLDDPDERAFCEAAGALGIDPYALSERDARFIEEAADLFSGEALIEFLAGVGDTARGELLSWVRGVEARPRERACLPELDGIVGRVTEATARRPAEHGWATGYRAARVFRNAMGIPQGETFDSLSEIAGRLGSESFRDAQRSVVNSLHRAERQAAGRAFAAEFLAPVESVLEMVKSGLDDDEIAGSFNVSPQVVAWQIDNRERIREACSERGPAGIDLPSESVEEDSLDVRCPEVSEEILEEEILEEE